MDIKKLAFNIFLFSLLSLTILGALGYIVDNGLQKSKMDTFSQWNDIYNSNINANLIICGASKSLVDISPRILDSILRTNSYNISMNGWPFYMQNERFKIYLQHNKRPRYIIQSADLSTFSNRQDLYNYEQFLPYLCDAAIKNITSEYKGAFSLPELYFPLFKYNNHFDLIKEGILCYFNIQHGKNASAFKGYMPRESSWDSSFSDFKKNNPTGVTEQILKKSVRKFEAFLDYCKSNDVKVILVFPPTFYEELAMEKNAPQIMYMYRNYSKKYGFPFLDYSNDSISYHKKYFYNSQHLNKAGAELFSNKLASDLKNIVAN